MMQVAPPWLSRVFALAILVLLGAILDLGLVQPLLDAYARDRVAGEQQEVALAHYREIGGHVAALSADLAALHQAQQGQRGFLEGANDVLVAAQLQDRLKRLVEAGQGRLQSTQVLPVRDEGKFRRLGVRGQMSLSTAGLQRVVYEIESGSPALFLDNLAVHRLETGGETPTDQLDVAFDLFGYVAPGD